LAGVLAIIVAALTAVMTFVNPNEKANAHQNAGNDYNSLRNEARIFYEVNMVNIVDENELTTELEELNSKRDAMNKEHIQIPKWAFRRARKGIEEGEGSYDVDRRK